MADAVAPASTERSDRYRTILRLGLPVVGGMVSQNVLNLVDTAMVGSLGDAALAGVGTGSFLNFFATAFVMGFSAGVQALVARRYGEGKADQVAWPLNAALLMVVVLGVPWSALLHEVAPSLYALVNDDPAVLAEGVPYLQARLLALTAVAVNFGFRGFFNGVNQPGLYMRTLMVMHATNIALNYVLIFGKLGAPELGALGAGVASAISTYVGSAVYFALGLRHARDGGFMRHLPSAEVFRTIVRVSLPTGVQQLLFAGSYTTLFWILGQVGTAATAAANVLVNLTLVAILPCIAFGISAASLVGQALGRGDVADAKRWGWQVAQVATAVIVLIALPMLAFPDLILGIFLEDPETLAMARAPLRVLAATLAFDAVALVLQNAHLGAGASRTAMIVSVCVQWLVYLPGAYLAGVVLGYGLLGIWVVGVLPRALQAIVFTVLWSRERWAEVKV